MPERATPANDDWSDPAGWGGSSGVAGPGGQSAGTSGRGWGDSPPASSPAPTPQGWQGAGSWASTGGPPPGPPPSAGGSWSDPARSAPTAIQPVADAQSSSRVVGPPTWLLIIGLVLPLAALPLTLVDTLPMNVVGWFVALFGSVIPLAVFTRVDLRRRLSRWYVDRPALLGVLRVAVLLVGLLVAGWFAYLIADEVARWEIWFS